MSAIGDYGYYVHYNALNYLNKDYYSDVKNNDNYFSNYAVRKLRHVPSSGLTAAQKRKFGNVLDALMSRQQAEGLTTGGVEKIQETIVDYVENTTKSKIVSQAEINKYTGEVLRKASLPEIATNALKEGSEKQGLLKKEDIEKNIKKIKQLQTAAENLINNSDNRSVYDPFISRLEETYSQLSELFSTLGDKDATGVGSPDLRKKIEEINSDGRKLGLIGGSLSLIQGDYGEAVVAVAIGQALGVGIQDAFNAITGNKQVQNYTAVQGSPSDMLDESFLSGQGEKTVNGIRLRAYRKSQSKADIFLEASQYPGIPQTGLGISVKNVKLGNKKWIHIVSGTTLSQVILDEERDFLRHLFNHIAGRRGYKHTAHKDEEKNARQTLKTQKEDAIVALKLLVGYKALSGHTYSENKASLFVVNDISSQRWFVLEISDLINGILRAVQKNKSLIDRYFDFDGLTKNLTVNRPWGATAEEGMSKFINNLHARKIRASLNSDIFINQSSFSEFVGKLDKM